MIFKVKSLEFARCLDIDINRFDIEACHRLKDNKKKNGPKRTIVRFVNRKVCDTLHKSKKKLNDSHNSTKLKNMGLGKIFINNNLCPYNKFLWGKCKQLHTEKLIDRFWVFNGHLYITDDLDRDQKGLKVLHFNTLKEKFPGFDFDAK